MTEPSSSQLQLAPGEVAYDAPMPAAGATPGGTTLEGDGDAARTDLTDACERHALGLDGRRTAAVAKRRGLNRRSARENIGDHVDPGSFVEYGALAIVIDPADTRRWILTLRRR